MVHTLGGRACHLDGGDRFASTQSRLLTATAVTFGEQLVAQTTSVVRVNV
jgi:hypothetical protein